MFGQKFDKFDKKFDPMEKLGTKMWNLSKPKKIPAKIGNCRVKKKAKKSRQTAKNAEFFKNPAKKTMLPHPPLATTPHPCAGPVHQPTHSKSPKSANF